jgi:fructoselysine and glucoselysine-specific PTS system IIB component
MSLVLVRVDDRLVHGQVMVGWRCHLGASTILVASDRLSASPDSCTLFRLGAPPEVSLVVDTVEGLADRILAGEFDGQRAILLVEGTSDVARLVERGVSFEHLNLGGLRHREGCLVCAPSICLNRADIDNLRRISGHGIPIDIQMVPLEKPLSLDLDRLERLMAGR